MNVVILAAILTGAGPVMLLAAVMWAATPRAPRRARHVPRHRASILRGLDFAAFARGHAQT